jgi:dienelactone hydrolase
MVIQGSADVGRPASATLSYRHPVASTKKLVAALSRRGPHRVLRGDLAFAGLPGIVYTPESGLNLPAVAFGHDWLTAADGYADTLEHLASWGIVAAAPGTETGVAPSVLTLSYDLGTTLDIVSGVRLGSGEISVHPGKLAVAGHGFGASAAVFAAAGLGARVRSAAAIFPANTRPPAEEPAATLKVPGVVFGAPDDPSNIRFNALELARAWPAAALRIVSKGEATGLAEGRRLHKFVGLGGSDKTTQNAVRPLLTGFLLYTLTGDKQYAEFSDAQVQLPRTAVADPTLAPLTTEEKLVALLRQ